MNVLADLLFAYLVLNDRLVSERALFDSCTGWVLNRHQSLKDHLIQNNLLSSEDAKRVERQLRRNVQLYGGDVSEAFIDLFLQAFRNENRNGIRQFVERVTSGGIAQEDAPSRPISPDESIALMNDEIVSNERQLGRFKLEREVARGGLGRVWLALDPVIGREVAIKELKRSQAVKPDSLSRFLREMTITGQLEHPNIVPVYEIGNLDTPRPYYAMRLVKGHTFTEIIEDTFTQKSAVSEKAKTEVEMRAAFRQICNAVSYAHSHGVVHRDLKPDNVIVGHFGEVLLLDWGLSKKKGENEELDLKGQLDPSKLGETVEGAILGTPGFLAPEQAAGKHDLIDERTDIFGLGAILYMMTTGREPHRFEKDDTPKKFLERIAAGPSPRVHQASPKAPKEIDAICAKAMAHSPEDRYQSVSELLADIILYEAGEPVSVFREPTTRRIGRWMRRHRGVTSFVVLTMILLMAMSSVLAYRNYSAFQSLNQVALDSLREQTFYMAETVERQLERLPIDLMVVGHLRSTDDLLTAAASTPKSLPPEKLNAFQARINRIVSYFPAIYSVVVVSAKEPTRELIRLQRDPKGLAAALDAVQGDPVPKEFLPMVEKCLKLTTEEAVVDEVRVYPTTTNPYLRGMVAAIPVFTFDHKEKLGVVLVTTNYQNCYEVMAKSGLVERTLLADENGYLLFDTGYNEGQQNPEAERAQELFPELADFFNKGSTERDLSIPHDRDSSLMLSARRIWVHYRDEVHSFAVVMTYPYARIYHDSDQRRYSLIGSAGLLLSVAAGLALFCILIVTQTVGARAR